MQNFKYFADERRLIEKFWDAHLLRQDQLIDEHIVQTMAKQIYSWAREHKRQLCGLHSAEGLYSEPEACSHICHLSIVSMLKERQQVFTNIYDVKKDWTTVLSVIISDRKITRATLADLDASDFASTVERLWPKILDAMVFWRH